MSETEHFYSNNLQTIMTTMHGFFMPIQLWKYVSHNWFFYLQMFLTIWSIIWLRDLSLFSLRKWFSTGLLDRFVNSSFPILRVIPIANTSILLFFRASAPIFTTSGPMKLNPSVRITATFLTSIKNKTRIKAQLK